LTGSTFLAVAGKNRGMTGQQAGDIDEGRYRALVNAITDYAVYMLDPHGVVASWNAGARRFKGYEPAEIIGKHFSCFYTPEDRQSGLPAYALAQAAEKGTFQSEGWRLRKDGTRFWASVVIDPIRDAQGHIEGFAKITRDLTERMQAERVLRASQEQFRLLVQGVTDYAIYMLDPEGRISSWNLGAQRIKGYAPEEIIGSHFSRFYTEEDRQKGEPARALETALRAGRFEKEGTRLRKDGTRFTAHVIIDPVRDDSGRLIGFAKVTRDITERKDAQIALERAREALFQSQKMDAIGQLTGGVAHDFNNLLMAILGSLELLDLRLPDDPKIKRLLDNAMQGARRGATLTQRMLAFARRQELKMEPVNIGALLHGITDLLQSSAGGNVVIETSLPLGLPPVRADINQLELAILNLATNARDAMPGGGKIMIAATLEQLETGNPAGLPAGHYVNLSVSDEGEGMDPEILTRAAEPFFTTKGVGKGTGLGLAMVYGMTQQMGGDLRLSSTPGRGTKAEIRLPVAHADARAAEKIREPGPEHVRALRVIAVDDDSLVLLNTVAMLEEMGHTVLEASSGVEALALLRDHPVDLVVTDQAMPKMTGLQLVEKLRAQPSAVPVIVATGYAELSADTPADILVLPKPFTSKELARAVARVMDRMTETAL
jgi:PAS domain S-box-containing protein